MMEYQEPIHIPHYKLCDSAGSEELPYQINKEMIDLFKNHSLNSDGMEIEDKDLQGAVCSKALRQGNVSSAEILRIKRRAFFFSQRFLKQSKF